MVQPDVYVLAAEDDQSITGAWPASVITLAIEISASTSRHDKRKMAAYARAAIPHAWRYDVAAANLYTYADPDPERAIYLLCRTIPTAPADIVAAVAAASDNLQS